MRLILFLTSPLSFPFACLNFLPLATPARQRSARVFVRPIPFYFRRGHRFPPPPADIKDQPRGGISPCKTVAGPFPFFLRLGQARQVVAPFRMITSFGGFHGRFSRRSS